MSSTASDGNAHSLCLERVFRNWLHDLYVRGDNDK